MSSCSAVEGTFDKVSPTYNDMRGSSPPSKEAGSRGWFGGVQTCEGKHLAGEDAGGPHGRGRRPHGEGPHVKEPHGRGPHGRDPHCRDLHGREPHGREPHGREPHGREPHGREPRGREPHGREPHGREPHGREPHGSEGREMGGGGPHREDVLDGPHGKGPHDRGPPGTGRYKGQHGRDGRHGRGPRGSGQGSCRGGGNGQFGNDCTMETPADGPSSPEKDAYIKSPRDDSKSDGGYSFWNPLRFFLDAKKDFKDEQKDIVGGPDTSFGAKRSTDGSPASPKSAADASMKNDVGWFGGWADWGWGKPSSTVDAKELPDAGLVVAPLTQIGSGGEVIFGPQANYSVNKFCESEYCSEPYTDEEGFPVEYNFNNSVENMAAAPSLTASSSAGSTTTASESVPENSLCVICMAAERSYSIIPCGHRILCETCKDLRMPQCPTCRGPCESVLKIFL
jgi:hypothetical protein